MNDPNLLFCEDFEAPAYYENVQNAWYSAPANDPAYRGANSLWHNRYGQTGANWWSFGTPASPKVGAQCGQGGGRMVCALKEYCSAAQGGSLGNDCWGGNSNSAIDIQRAGDFRAENGSLTLRGGTGTTSDVGAGNAHLAYRNQVNDTGGIIGEARFSRTSTEIGITMMLAYGSNTGTNGVLAAQWKHDEWTGSASGFIDHWNLGRYATGGGRFPYSPFLFTTSESACNAALANATVDVGSAGCFSNPSLWYNASSSAYNQATDFPFGTWACHRAHLKGLGTSNVELTIWHNDRIVFRMRGFDGAAIRNKYYRGFTWNNYANAGGLGQITQTAFRYQDNVHVTAGPPVSCSAIGFGGGSPPPPPPTSLPAPFLLP